MVLLAQNETGLLLKDDNDNDDHDADEYWLRIRQDSKL